MDATQIRPAASADLDAIAAIYAHEVRHGTGTFEVDPPDRDEMAGRLAKVIAAGVPWLVAATEAGVVGYAYAGPFRERAAYRPTVECSVYVAATARGQGVGRALLEALVEAASAAGFTQMLALIGDSANAGSIRLHAACGFAHVGVLARAGFKLDRWLDVVVMQRALGATAVSSFEVVQPTVPVLGGGRVPVRRVYCIGRNFPDHAREMGDNPRAAPPFFFQKPADAVWPVAEGEIGALAYPPLTKSYHHEIELVVVLKSGGRDIAPERALDHVFGYAVGLDMTRRDLQQRMKDGRKPWEIGKSFDASAPMGPVVPVDRTGHLSHGAIKLRVNGAVRQTGDLADMIWSVPEQIAALSLGSELKAGDVIFSGTPAGVDAVTRGDLLEASIAGLPTLRLRVV